MSCNDWLSGNVTATRFSSDITSTTELLRAAEGLITSTERSTLLLCPDKNWNPMSQNADIHTVLDLYPSKHPGCTLLQYG